MSYGGYDGALSGAEYLASIYGTEKDKVNCSFYFKVSGFNFFLFSFADLVFCFCIMNKVDGCCLIPEYGG